MPCYTEYKHSLFCATHASKHASTNAHDRTRNSEVPPNSHAHTTAALSLPFSRAPHTRALHHQSLPKWTYNTSTHTAAQQRQHWVAVLETSVAPTHVFRWEKDDFLWRFLMSRLRAGSTSVAFITCCCCCWCSSSSCCCVRANYVLFDVYSSRCAMRMWVALLLPCARRPCSNCFRAKPNSLGVVGGWPQLWWTDGAPQGQLLPTSRYIRTAVSRFSNPDCFKKWKKSAVSYWHSFSSFLP